MIKFEHSVFALPFALTGALLAVREGGNNRHALWVKIAWFVVAVVGGRSAAMAFNRLTMLRLTAATRARVCVTFRRGRLVYFRLGLCGVSSLVFVCRARAKFSLFRWRQRGHQLFFIPLPNGLQHFPSGFGFSLGRAPAAHGSGAGRSIWHSMADSGGDVLTADSTLFTPGITA